MLNFLVTNIYLIFVFGHLAQMVEMIRSVGLDGLALFVSLVVLFGLVEMI